LGWYSNFAGICINPLAQSIIEKYLELPRVSKIYKIIGIGKLPLTMMSFIFLKSTITLHFCLQEAFAYLGTIKIGEYPGLVLG
jgi:hypothetical protein